jgi:hypothetical protein
MDPVNRSGFAVLVTATLLASACGGPPPAVTADRVERLQCDPGSDETRLVQLFSGSSVLGAEPRYSHVLTMNNNAEERICGAKILMRPPEGMSAEQVTRLLQCHGARAVLGRIDGPELSEDPFWLPDAWVSIEVKPDDGNYAVTTETDRLADNIRLAALAAAFAQAHGAPASGPSME